MLRHELAQAAAVATTQDTDGVFMTVEEAQIELQVELITEVKGSAEINVWVVKLGGEAGSSVGDTHKVTLTVQPRTLDGTPLQVSARGAGLPSPPPTD